MSQLSEDKNSIQTKKTSDHLANERTFLAWIRTCIGIMAFGFVIEKFTLFIKQVSWVLGKSSTDASSFSTKSGSYSSIMGILVVALGVVIAMLAFIKYKKVEKQIDQNIYQPSVILDILLTLLVLLIGVLLVLYLIHTL